MLLLSSQLRGEKGPAVGGEDLVSEDGQMLLGPLDHRQLLFQQGDGALLSLLPPISDPWEVGVAYTRREEPGLGIPGSTQARLSLNASTSRRCRFVLLQASLDFQHLWRSFEIGGGV